MWREGPPWAAAPAAGIDRDRPLCQHTAPALTWGQQDRGSCLQEAGVSAGRGCPGPSDGREWVWSVLPRPRNSSQTWPWRVLGPGLTQAWGGGVEADGLIKNNNTTVTAITTTATAVQSSDCLGSVCAVSLTPQGSPTGRALRRNSLGNTSGPFTDVKSKTCS